MRRCLMLSLLCLLLASCLLAQQPQLRNVGFENVAGDKIGDWTCPDYWSGEFTSVTDPALVHGGKRAAQLKAVAKDGRTWGRIHSALMPVQVGLDHRFSVYARGTGGLKLGVINYLPNVGNEMKYETRWQEPPAALTDQWQEVALDFSPVSYEVERLALMIEVEGEGAAALLDDADLQVVRQAEGRLDAGSYVMSAPGGEVTSTALIEREGQPAALPVLVVKRTTAGVETEQATSDADGHVHLKMKGFDTPQLVRRDLVQRDLGLTATTFVDVVPMELSEQFWMAAKQARPKELPQHWLFFGDSLTDFSRGYNYVDQVGWWVSCFSDGQLTYRNAGVGGDYITRSLDRLNGKAGTYRLEAYDGVFEPKPTRVFMMLGHNDSKLTSTSGFTEAVVKPEDYKAQYIEFINKVKAQTGASFTLLSPTSSVYEITKANADKAVAAGRGASLFGKPEVMEQYTLLTKEVAEATGSDFIDVHAPTQQHPNKPTLFTADGVHLSLEGNHVLALEILKHMGK